MADFTIVAAFLGALAGFAFAVLFDQLKSPVLRIRGHSSTVLLPNFDLYSGLLPPGPVIQGTVPVILQAIRVPVINRERWVLNDAARNCTAWMELEGATERFQLSWVGSHATVDINVGDQREIDFCALVVGHGLVVAPTEAGYSAVPRMIGAAGAPITGTLRVTSENAKSSSIGFSIETNATTGNLTIVFPQ